MKEITIHLSDTREFDARSGEYEEWIQESEDFFNAAGNYAEIHIDGFFDDEVVYTNSNDLYFAVRDLLDYYAPYEEGAIMTYE